MKIFAFIFDTVSLFVLNGPVPLFVLNDQFSAFVLNEPVSLFVLNDPIPAFVLNDPFPRFRWNFMVYLFRLNCPASFFWRGDWLSWKPFRVELTANFMEEFDHVFMIKVVWLTCLNRMVRYHCLTDRTWPAIFDGILFFSLLWTS